MPCHLGLCILTGASCYIYRYKGYPFKHIRTIKDYRCPSKLIQFGMDSQYTNTSWWTLLFILATIEEYKIVLLIYLIKTVC